MGFVVEDAKRPDLRAIASLNVASYEQFGRGLAAEEWQRMLDNLSRPEPVAERAAFIVIRDKDALVGSVAYCPPGRSIDPIPKDWASVLLLAVDPDHRQRGYGEALVRECLRRAAADGAAVIGLYTSEAMEAAQHLYSCMGFARECELPRRYGMRYFRYRLPLRESGKPPLGVAT